MKDILKICRIVIMDERIDGTERVVAKGNVVQGKDREEYVEFLIDTGFTIRIWVKE